MYTKICKVNSHALIHEGQFEIVDIAQRKYHHQLSIVWILPSAVLRSTGKEMGQRKAFKECINELVAPKGSYGTILLGYGGQLRNIVE